VGVGNRRRRWARYRPAFRGFDLANATFVKGDTGWIVFDPLTAPETAAAAKKLVDEHLGELPVVAVV
jgi:alkyl sulfatase BDS1-like metallo-beta-lactamase superfamily hydrolase